MDSFITITSSAPFSLSVSEETTTQVQYEKGGGAGNGYCVIAHQEVEDNPNLVEFEKHGGAGNGYCIIT